MSEAERQLVARLAAVVEAALPRLEQLRTLTIGVAEQAALDREIDEARRALVVARTR